LFLSLYVCQYLERVHGFEEKNMIILMDDGKHHTPTRRNIEDAFRRIVEYSQAGDVVFIHYSGHGGRVRDTSGDEEDGYDETLIPVDFKSAGQIVDDDILRMLVKPMREGVQCTVLMDVRDLLLPLISYGFAILSILCCVMLTLLCLQNLRTPDSI
jgi:metacaspase-1